MASENIEKKLEENVEKNIANVENYLGRTFVTVHNSYYIDDKGEFKGRPSIEGAKVQLVAGIEEDVCFLVWHCLSRPGAEYKDKLDKIIKKHGKEPRPGLYLVASLTCEAVQDKNRNGIITSRLRKIEYHNNGNGKEKLTSLKNAVASKYIN